MLFEVLYSCMIIIHIIFAYVPEPITTIVSKLCAHTNYIGLLKLKEDTYSFEQHIILMMMMMMLLLGYKHDLKDKIIFGNC